MWSSIFGFNQWRVAVLLLLMTVSPSFSGKCLRPCSCDLKKLTVACIGKNLTKVPPTIDEITVKLDLRKNDLQELPRGSFQHTPYLTHLNLQSSNIRSVREGAFRGLGRLVYLNLAHNNIDVLYQESFDGLLSLKQLLIDHNRVEEVQPGAFTQMGSLNLLSLTHNRLVYLPNMAFQGLLNIQWLKLSHNSLNNLATEAFASLFTLTRLSLDHNELQFFPTQTMTRLVEVTHLEMSYNPMIYMGEETVSMAKLTHLYLDHMSLQDLSDGALIHAPLLSHLDLSHNQLRSLEPILGPRELSFLNLTGNPTYCNCHLRPLREWAQVGQVKLLGLCAGPPHLSEEPLEAVEPADLRCRGREGLTKEELEEAEEAGAQLLAPPPKPQKKVGCPDNCECEPEAQHATCEDRGHTKVPQGFLKNTSLLDLRDNHFHNVPSNSFRGLAKVVSLHLDRCKIREIEAGAFRGMKGLLYLYLTENDLTSLEPDTFAGAPQITYLHLDGNRLTQFLSAATLAPMPSLLELNLEGNAISKLESAGMLSSVKMLRALYLANNTIDSVVAEALDPAPHLDNLHLEGNKLTEVPSKALGNAPLLRELHLSGNPIRWVGPKAFMPIAQSLQRLYLDGTGLAKMSKDSLAGLGSGMLTLSLKGNQLESLPSLSSLTGLQEVNLADNPLLCDCNLLLLRKWMDNVSLTVSATCGHPAELQGQSVKDVSVFQTCPEDEPSPSKPPLKAKGAAKAPKKVKPKPSLLKGGKPKMSKAKPKPVESPKPSALPKPAKKNKKSKKITQR
ncbi:chondroadherin-like protein [Alosa pseudoharengus]|uniref:chondroadherin-like protein n=1 Tax=Alosa pseudoharengus TaxID=34774 RepID=UPI003F8B9C18